MITAKKLSFSYGAEDVFREAEFRVNKNQKVGLVGPNGAGKSTLFNLLTGKESVLGGTLKVCGTIGFVPQEVKHDPTLSSAKSLREYLDPQSEFQDFELMKLLDGLEFTSTRLQAKPKKLSGGQKTKLALARALLAKPDILLLDEPTNFMDKAGKYFVMNFLSNYPKTVMVVSHDLTLLDRAIDKVLAINTQTRKIDAYKGNYSKYMKLKKEQEELLKRQIVAKQKHITQMEAALPKLYKYTSKKGVRARKQQQKRIAREKAALPPMPQGIRTYKLALAEPTRVGELPFRLVHVSKSYDRLQVLDSVNFSLLRNEKFVLIGPNGSGKSTLIKIVMDMVKPDSGYVEYGANFKAGYYSQEFEAFDLSEKVLDVAQRIGEIPEQRARGFLARFFFGNQKVRQSIGSLSGGEKTRLSIALLMLENNNVLILDEPTTYLDPVSQRIILEAIKEYKGTLLLVSHVEDFIRELKPDRAMFMPEQKVVLWSDEYLDKISEV